jgi:hypothetical protein
MSATIYKPPNNMIHKLDKHIIMVALQMIRWIGHLETHQQKSGRPSFKLEDEKSLVLDKKITRSA